MLNARKASFQIFVKSIHIVITWTDPKSSRCDFSQIIQKKREKEKCNSIHSGFR